MEKGRWLAPLYYLDFRCKADKCRNSCCSNWRIPISKDEYNKMITMDCSKQLSEKIQMTFEVPEITSDDCFRYISFDWLGKCRLLDDGLCYLHREKGEEYLPKICRLYPRSLKNINGVNLATCSSSCEKVVELLFNVDSLNIKQIELNDKAQIYYEVSEEDVKQIKLFQDLIKDKTTTLAESIEDICKIINKEEFEKDYNQDIDYLDNCISLLKRFYGSNSRLDLIIDTISDRYKNTDQFESDRKLFEERYPDWMHVFERIINNSMLYDNYPFVDKRIDKTHVYKGLCCTYGLLRMVCIGVNSISDNLEDLIDAIASLFHLIDHTAFYYNVSILADNAAVMLKV